MFLTQNEFFKWIINAFRNVFHVLGYRPYRSLPFCGFVVCYLPVLVQPQCLFNSFLRRRRFSWRHLTWLFLSFAVFKILVLYIYFDICKIPLLSKETNDKLKDDEKADYISQLIFLHIDYLYIFPWVKVDWSQRVDPIVPTTEHKLGAQFNIKYTAQI